MPGTDEGDFSPTGLPAAAPVGAALFEVLDSARQLGFLGPGPPDLQLRHAQGFLTVARRVCPDRPLLMDLGSGGGLPGLVVAAGWPEATVVLLDANQRRTAFLAQAVERLALGDQVSVRQDRAETAGRDESLRASFDGVLARSFGRPAVLAECAAPFLRLHGSLVVSEPPARESRPEERWPRAPLEALGLVPGSLVHEEFDYQIVHQAARCPDRYPRRNGVPAKKPLF